MGLRRGKKGNKCQISDMTLCVCRYKLVILPNNNAASCNTHKKFGRKNVKKRNGRLKCEDNIKKGLKGSLVHRSPTECGASECVIVKRRQWGGPGPLGAFASLEKKKYRQCTVQNLNSIKFYNTVCCHLLKILVFLHVALILSVLIRLEDRRGPKYAIDSLHLICWLENA
jgi:hypothetical protein